MLYLPYEIIKDIPWYWGIYKCSNMWNVYSYRYNRIRLLKCWYSDWYKTYKLCVNWNPLLLYWHRIIYKTFINLVEDYNICVCHINDIRSDNRLCNLRLWTRKENNIDCIKKNRHTTRYKNKSKIKIDTKINILKILWKL